jgi:hypothetical protein
VNKMPERMTREEAKIEQAIRAARIAKQTLLEETRNSMPLVVEEEEVDVEDAIEEKPTIKVPNQDKEGFGLAGVEGEYKIKKEITDEDRKSYPYRLGVALGVIKIVRDYLKNKSSVDDLTDEDFKNIKRVIDSHKDISDSK